MTSSHNQPILPLWQPVVWNIYFSSLRVISTETLGDLFVVGRTQLELHSRLFFFFLNNIWVLASRAAMHDEAAAFFYWPLQLNTHHSADSFTASSLAAEFLFLLWAVYLCYAVRTVPSAFHEPRYMAIAVHNELILSAIFYVIRYCLCHVGSVKRFGWRHSFIPPPLC